MMRRAAYEAEWYMVEIALFPMQRFLAERSGKFQLMKTK